MKIIESTQLDYSDVLLVPQRSNLSSRSEVELTRKYKFPHSSQIMECIGVTVANMDTVGTFEMAKSLNKNKMIVALHKHYTASEIIDFFKQDQELALTTFVGVGSSQNDYDKIEEIYRDSSDYVKKNFKICLDVANGYSTKFVYCVRSYRKRFNDAVIMAGNICTPNMTEELILAGADVVKVGIGSGSVCSTRIKTGVGFPQLSATDACAHAAHGLGGHICSDGGITCAGDFCKAFAAGADFVMAGGFFSGTDECNSKLKIEFKDLDGMNHKKLAETYSFLKDVKDSEDISEDVWSNIYLLLNRNNEITFKRRKFNDTSSLSTTYVGEAFYAGVSIATSTLSEFLETQLFSEPSTIKLNLEFIPLILREFEKHIVSKKTVYYGMSSKTAQEKYHGELKEYRAAEGKKVEVDYKGPVETVVQDILGGLRSACTYLGSKNLKDLPKCAQFIKVNNTHNRVFGDNWQED